MNLLLVILAPFLYALFIPFLYKHTKHIHTGWFVLWLPIILFVYLLNFVPVVAKGDIIKKTIDWVPSLGVNFTVYIDGLGLLFALLITGLGTLVVLYSIYYLSLQSEPLNNFYVYLLLFMGAMLGVVLSDNLIVLYVFWELTSLSSSLLIAYWYQREKSRYGALKSLFITVAGGFAMLAGFVLLYAMTGTFSIREIIAQTDIIVNHVLFVPSMILILLGAFSKSAQFPFHIWLPDAMEAPTPISAYLHSATMVKAGIFLVARLSPIYAGNPHWFWIISIIGIITLFWGAFFAIRQTDLKSILAYSTVSQLGLIMCLLGLGSAAVHYNYEQIYTVATLAAILHLINHATFKGSLFMVAGIIDHQTGTRDIDKLGGLVTIMPITFTLAIIGSCSMAGIFPFNGFLSKELFYTGLINSINIETFNMELWGITLIVIAWIASIFTFVYSMIVVFKSFMGKHKPYYLKKEPKEASLGLIIPPAILAFLVVILGLFPNILSQSIIAPTMHSIYALAPTHIFEVNIYHWHGLTPELFMTIGVIVIGFLLYKNLDKWLKVYSVLKLNKKEPLNTIYDWFLELLDRASLRITQLQMTGLLRDYLAYILIFMIFLIGYTFSKYVSTQYVIPEISIYSWYILIFIFMAICTTISILFINSRVTAIIITGIIGFQLALFFVIFRAPDLALTKLLIETVMTVLFLLCFYHLPKLKKETFKSTFKLTNALISIGVGLMVTVIAFTSMALSNENPIKPISNYFIENSYELAGGKNLVNVILVDFRGLDTLLEVLVLAIAALGLIALIKHRVKGKEDI
ncbi:Na(+) H(+) antiporter subunit A [Candidatus Syntrophocurvum alkaliphilum]|uniref:Na(+) H(+) antiporter subunit A n=1 Tax=Candidatus Syntrophocurvum alkaliphilum TaxID=2293317 RepID=A0A6I6DEH2_9FIRM|nr:Na+/H+ antiporter subunit A [Candidatus Syntrophocurvum alkaliphilum]QGT99422.1 Na(+) H(+) antiporter subunit A [Candidatus Syntrophocurvum alkaliphilum]